MTDTERDAAWNDYRLKKGIAPREEWNQVWVYDMVRRCFDYQQEKIDRLQRVNDRLADSPARPYLEEARLKESIAHSEMGT